MLPDFDSLVAQARASIRPYRWLVKQAHCRACGSMHERAPLLMCETQTGWSFETTDDGTHDNACVVFEKIELAWCTECNTPAAKELTVCARDALNRFGNTAALAGALRHALESFETASLKEHFHHV